jgi:hypothetical protein
MDDSIRVIPGTETPAPPYTPPTPLSKRSKDPIPSQESSAQPTFIAALPLAELKEGPAPVDCPACGVRTLTKREYRVGDNASFIPL